MQKIPRGVWILGFVGLFMDVSSKMIHAMLPLFIVGTFGASAALLGLMEELAEATAQIMKLFSGVLSDRWRNRKELALTGDGLAAAVKPLFPLADSVNAVFFARFADRIGKGIRGAPRDAMIADMTPQELRGEAFGLHQSLDTIGAFFGSADRHRRHGGLRGTSFGMFNLVNVVALLLSNLIAGLLRDAGGAPMTFLAGAAFALLVLAGASWVKTPAVEVKARPSKQDCYTRVCLGD
jgi:MFS transporter